MNTLEIEIDFRNGAPPVRDWISEDQLDDCKREATEHGATLKTIGRVSWQRQLAAMENPEI